MDLYTKYNDYITMISNSVTPRISIGTFRMVAFRDECLNTNFSNSERRFSALVMRLCIRATSRFIVAISFVARATICFSASVGRPLVRKRDSRLFQSSYVKVTVDAGECTIFLFVI